MAIDEFIEENLFEPSIHWPKEEFDRKSSERWAAKEIKQRIKKSKICPVDTVYIFMKEMQRYSYLDDISKHNAKMFQYAYEIADEIGSILC